MAAWEERLNQLERNFLAEVERLKDDILGQLKVDDEKYYTNIDNEVNTSFTSPSPSSAYASPSTSPSGSFRGVVKNGREGQHEVPNGAADGDAGGEHAPPEAKTVKSTSSFSSTVVPASLRQSQLALSPGTLSSSSSSSTPPPALPPQAPVEGDHIAGASKSRRVAPARQAEALVVRVRAAYKFESQEEDELPLPKGLELIAFMREDESWWWGQRPDGRVGIFPSNFVTVLEGNPEALPIREDDPSEEAAEEEQQQQQQQQQQQHGHESYHHQQAQQPPAIDNHGGAAVVEDGARPKPPPPAGPKPLARQGSQQRLEKMKVSKGAASPPPARSSSYNHLSSSGSSVSQHTPHPLTSSSDSFTAAPIPAAAATPASAASVVPPPAARHRPSPPPPAAHLKPASLVGAPTHSVSPAAAFEDQHSQSGAPSSADVSATHVPAVRQRPAAASAPQGRTPLTQDREGSSSPRPAVPRSSLKPTQRGEASRKDWHDKRKSIMMLQEQSRTTHLLAQWEQAGAGITFAPPPSRPV